MRMTSAPLLLLSLALMPGCGSSATTTSEASCGNGLLDNGEVCDDGNGTGGDGCTALCQLEAGYICPVVGNACVPLRRWGDGVVSSPETCDDGNLIANDGCSEICQIEPGFKCSGQPSVCSRTVCGDGIAEGTEGCDDGNAVSGDDCSKDCQVEPSCVGTTCAARCGDGILVDVEDCDDGNRMDGDGCSKACRLEEGWVSQQKPAAIANLTMTQCQALCGDGVAVAGEECDDGALNGATSDSCNLLCRWPRP